MVFFSNGQNESSRSVGTSGSDTDSQENRFYSKAKNSQRQQSSSTSASSSESEPEQVSARPVAEMPVAPPSPKKKPSSGSDSDSQEKRFYSKTNNSQRQQSSSTSASSSESEPDQVSARPVAEKPVAPPSPKKKPSSGSDADSQEKRFYTKAINSQRHQSSSISPSSSDSEPEQVSARPVSEKPVAPPSPKKKPSTADRSAVRNQGTPPEPNLKTPFAPKPKRISSAKRAREYDDAEEQPEPKKKSVSKGKKPAEEEIAKDDDAAEEQTELKKKSVSKGKKPAEAVPTSNPTKKKPRKQPQESATVVAVATPSVKDSPLKSSKKKAHVWTDSDEGVIMDSYLVCVKEGLEFPKNIPQLLEKINNSLAHEASKPQLYDKLRRMKLRYEFINNKIAQDNIKEDGFAYKSPHEREMYKLWKHAWGEHNVEDEMDVEPAGDAMELDRSRAVGDDPRRVGEVQITTGAHGEEDEEEEEEVESDAGTNTVKDPKIFNTDKAPVSNHMPAKALVLNHIPSKALCSLTLMPNDNPEDTIDYKTIMKETMDMVDEVITDVKKMVEDSEAKMKALVDSNLGSANGTRGTGGGSGKRINSAVWLTNREPGLDGIYSLRELPPLGEGRVQMLEGKWREVQIFEMEVRAKRLALLREECSMHLQELNATGRNTRS